jgi:voltage-gated potassium channel
MALYLDTNHRYKKIKLFFYNILNNQKYQYKKYLDIFMVSLVFLSIWIIIYEVNHKMDPIWKDIEDIMLVIFIIEYLLRVWVSSDIHKAVIRVNFDCQFLNIDFDLKRAFKIILKEKFDYIRSPMAIVDLLAILPNFRALRFLRLFLVFRLFKLFRYANSISEFTKVIVAKKFEFLTIGIMLIFVMFLFSTAIFFFEGGGKNEDINDFFDAMYWSLVTISTVGYGDISPTTFEGRIVTILLILSGIGIVSLITSVMVSAFSEKLDELKNNRIKAEVDMMSDYIILCGYSKITRIIARKFYQDHKKFVVIEKDPQKALQCKLHGYLTQEADATNSTILKEVGVGSGAHTIIALTGCDITNIYITLSARDIDKNIKIISMTNQKSSRKKLLLAGANEVYYPYQNAAMLVKEYIGQPVAFEAIYGILSGIEDVFIDEIQVFDRKFFVGNSIGDIDFTRYRLILFGIVRSEDKSNTYTVDDKEFLFNPKKDMILEENDILIVLGHRVSLAHFKQEIEKSIIDA